MGRRNNFCTDEETTRRAVDWLRNGAKSRGLELDYLIGRTLGGIVINGEIPSDRLAVVSAAIIGDLAKSWQKEIISGAKLDDDDLSIAAVCSAAFASLVGISKGELDLDSDESADAFIEKCMKIMDEGADE